MNSDKGQLPTYAKLLATLTSSRMIPSFLGNSSITVSLKFTLSFLESDTSRVPVILLNLLVVSAATTATRAGLLRLPDWRGRP